MVTVRYDSILYDSNTGMAANSTSYVLPTTHRRAIQYNSGDYVSPTVYAEYLFKCVNASTNHHWCRLEDIGTSDTPTTGTEVSSSPYERTSTTRSWSRTSALSLTDGNRYVVTHKNETTASTTVCLYMARLVVVDEIGAYYPTKTWGNFCIGSVLTTPDSTTSASYDRPACSGEFLYTSTDYAVTPEIYFEANLSSSSTSYYAYAILYDVTSAADVTSTDVSTNVVATTTGGIRCRSGNIVSYLTSGHKYSFRIKRGTGGTAYSWNEFLIIKQTSGSLSKCRFFHPLGGCPTGNNTTSYVARYCPGWLHETDHWTITPSWKVDFSVMVASASTATAGLLTIATTTLLTNSEATGTDTTYGTRHAGAGTPAPADGTAYSVGWKDSTTVYAYCKTMNLYFDVTFTAAPSGFIHSFAVIVG